MVTVAAAQPGSVGRLIRQFMRRYGMKLRSKQFRVRSRHPEYHERAGIAEHGSSYLVGQLVQVLVRKSKVACELARLRQKRCEGFRGEALELVDMDEER